jgi:subtilisin family serine protease
MMSLLDINCSSYGGLTFQTLNIEKTHTYSQGSGITVAILDHTFNKNHPALKNQVVAPKSFIEGVPALSENSGHGTIMAMDLVKVAPEVNIMPVVISGGKHWGVTDLYVQGINYAVENGADIISCSQTAIKGDQEKLDEAIQNATDNNVSVVYINYSGKKEEVVVPGMIEFAELNDDDEIVYVAGTNFLHKISPITWGRSHTAPMVAGVIALLKEIDAGLKPNEIKDILLNSTKTTDNGYPLLDAFIAVKNLNNY